MTAHSQIRYNSTRLSESIMSLEDISNESLILLVDWTEHPIAKEPAAVM